MKKFLLSSLLGVFLLGFGGITMASITFQFYASNEAESPCYTTTPQYNQSPNEDAYYTLYNYDDELLNNCASTVGKTFIGYKISRENADSNSRRHIDNTIDTNSDAEPQVDLNKIYTPVKYVFSTNDVILKAYAQWGTEISEINIIGPESVTDGADWLYDWTISTSDSTYTKSNYLPVEWNGSAWVNGTHECVPAGYTVGFKITLTPEEGYTFSQNLTINYNGENRTNSGHTTFDLENNILYIDLGEVVASTQIFHVNFDTNGHGVVPSQTINSGDKIADPGNLTAPGYHFEGWSDNEYLTTNFDFGIIPTDDITLYAKWRVPGEKCYEGFEYDNNLGMCIKKNEWVVRVGLDGGIIISSGYSDFLEDLVTLLITGDYKSKMGNFDIAKNYFGIMLINDDANDDVLDVDSDDSLSTEGQIVEVFEKHGDEKDLLFTMNTKASCRGDGPNCKFYNQNIEVAEGIPEWHNLKLVVPGYLKQQFGSLTGIIRADNIRLIFDPRVAVTFDSNGHGISPERQFLNKGSRIINPGSLSAVGYKFLGWSDNEYLTSIFDFNTVVNGDTKLYAKWKPIGDIYNCPEGQEYDNSVGVCKKPTDWMIRIGYQGDVEFSSGYSLFIDEALLNDVNLEEEMSQSEAEVFKKAAGILIAAELFDGTDEIMPDEIVIDGDLWSLGYYNKDGKLLFTVVVDMAGTEFHSTGGWGIEGSIHTRSIYVNLARDVSSLDNLKLVPSSTDINEYVEKYPPIAQLENLRIVFSDRMEPNTIDNGGKNYSGGGGHSQGGNNKDSKIDENSSTESQDDIQHNSAKSGEYSEEFQQAYEFAYKNGITTMATIEKADMEGGLTRIAMAKMLSNYAINVLGKKPANIVVPDFKDITNELDEQYDFGVTLGYQLGIMGINIPDNRFRPNDLVTRAEFATALSRMLFSTPDGDPYYVTHMAKLKEEGIITNDDASMKELRGYVMIMLMRSSMRTTKN